MAALQTLPPGLGEAVVALSKTLLRPRWHCQRLAAQRPPPPGSWRPAPQPELPAAAFAPSQEEALAYAAFLSDEALPPADVVAEASRELDAGFEDEVILEVDRGHRRRLEVTLRGAFRVPRVGAGGPGDQEEEEDDEQHRLRADDDDDEAQRFESPSGSQAKPRALTASPLLLYPGSFRGGGDVGASGAAASWRDGPPRPRTVAATPLAPAESEDIARELMGFGRGEFGALPSGRVSVPAVRGSSSSAPPPLAPRADEGVELDGLAEQVEHHVRRALTRSLRAERSRAGSCEPPGEESCSCSPVPSPESPEPLQARPSPSPPPGGSSGRGGGSPSACLTPRNTEDLILRLDVSVRLCWSRCGSSSAVLELILDHHADCREGPPGAACCCRPRPMEAEARLLAHFARHSLLRLVSTGPALRVLLEPLPDEAEEVQAAAGR